MRVVIGTGFVGTAVGDGFCSRHHKSSAGTAGNFFVIADVAGRFCFYRIFAFRIIGTAVKKPEPSSALRHHSVFADRAGDTGRITLFQLSVFFNVFALRIIVAGNKSAEFALAFDKLAFLALGASFSGFFRSGKLFACDFSRSDTIREFGST